MNIHVVVFGLNLLYTSDSWMHTLANSKDPDEMSHNAAFHQSALFAKINQPSGKEIQFLSGNYNHDP